MSTAIGLLIVLGVLLVHSLGPQGTNQATRKSSTPGEDGLVDFYVDLQSHVEHHGGDEVDVGEPDPQAPCEVEEYQQGPRQPLGEHPVGPAGGPRKS